MHVVVTGGAGFIGSHLVEYHLAKGDRVHAIDDLSTGTLENTALFLDNSDYRFTQADILTWPDLNKAIAWADRIYHMAAIVGVFRVLEDPIRVLAINIAACERVLRAANSGNWKPQIVIASSSEVYGNGHDEFEEDANLIIESSSNPRWNYAISKLTAEVFALSYAREADGPSVVVARLFNTIGPRQSSHYGMVLPRLVKQALSGDPLTVFGDGTQTRCFCDVRDTVRALDLLASDKLSNGQIFNVGNQQEICINDLAKRVRKLTNSSSEIKKIAYHIAYGTKFEDIHRRSASFSKLSAAVDFKPEHELDESIIEIVANVRAGTSTKVTPS